MKVAHVWSASAINGLKSRLRGMGGVSNSDACRPPGLSDAQRPRPGQAPAETGALAERRAECDHWAGEEPYDKAGAREIDAAVAKLRCEGIDADTARLKRKYAGQPRLRKLLAAE